MLFLNTSFGSSGRINGVNYKGIYRLGFHNVAVAHINRVVVLTGFSYKQINAWTFHRDKKMAVITKKP